jgi:hypothetical protein
VAAQPPERVDRPPRVIRRSDFSGPPSRPGRSHGVLSPTKVTPAAAYHMRPGATLAPFTRIHSVHASRSDSGARVSIEVLGTTMIEVLGSEGTIEVLGTTMIEVLGSEGTIEVLGTTMIEVLGSG